MDNNRVSRNTLVAILKYKSDLSIALNKNWYRIPLKTKKTPPSVSENKLEYIAFYQTSIFGEEAFKIRWYAKVESISVVNRKDLFPDEPSNAKTYDKYYRIDFEKCTELVQPIVSKRHRRMLFVNTTYERLINASEFNDLFIESPIEESLWQKLRDEKIEAERQFMLQTKNKFYYLDFALFCKERNLNVECDGDEYHLSVNAVKYDKNRNNELTKLGWVVLRYHTDQIKSNINNVINQVKETINRYGGLQVADDASKFKFYSTNDQIQLF